MRLFSSRVGAINTIVIDFSCFETGHTCSTSRFALFDYSAKELIKRVLFCFEEHPVSSDIIVDSSLWTGSDDIGALISPRILGRLTPAELRVLDDLHSFFVEGFAWGSAPRFSSAHSYAGKGNFSCVNLTTGVHVFALARIDEGYGAKIDLVC